MWVYGKLMKAGFHNFYLHGKGPGSTIFIAVTFFFNYKRLLSLHKLKPHLDPPLVLGRGFLVQTFRFPSAEIQPLSLETGSGHRDLLG